MRRFVYICLLLLAFASSAVADVWTHRAAITVNNAGGMVTDYTLRVSFGASDSLLFDWSQANGADWRFRKKDGLTTLNHWMQWWGTDRDTAIVLVRLDTLQPGTDTLYVYVGNDTALSTSNGAAVCPLFLDFSQDYTASGVTDILHMQGLGVDTFRHIVMDTSAVERQFYRVEQGNILCNPGAPAGLRYVHIYPACGRSSCDTDSFWMYIESSPDGFTWTRMGRLDTLGGNAASYEAVGEDAYTILYDDTLWNYYEHKAGFLTPCATYPKCDRIGLCYSADNGLSWTFLGKVVDDSSSRYPWLVSPSSPTALIWPDTTDPDYPERRYKIYLSVETKGRYGTADCGAGTLSLFGARHPRGPFDVVTSFPCSAAVGGVSVMRAGVPDQFFTINDSIYLDAHVMHGPSIHWWHTRFLLGDAMDTLLAPRFFSHDTMLARRLAGVIISQDILRDSSWMTWAGGHAEDQPAPPLGGAQYRQRTMFTDRDAVPDGWSAVWKNSTFGFHQARDGVLLLAAEPFRADSGGSSIAILSDTGFTDSFVIETYMKIKWDTLSPYAVFSAGGGLPSSLVNSQQMGMELAMDSGMGIAFRKGTNASKLFSLGRNTAATTLAYATVPDSLMNGWRVHHLAYFGDTLRWWVDGSSAALRPKGRTTEFKNVVKRIMLSSGEGYTRTVVPAGRQMHVDWLLVRKYHQPVPTVAVGYSQDGEHSYTNFDTLLYADRDACLHAGNPTYNYGMRDSLLAGQSSGSPVYSLFHFDFSGLDSGLTIASAVCSLYVNSSYGGPLISLYSINYDWFEGAKRGAAADSHECCWNWRGYGSGSVTNGTIPQAEMAWGSPVIGPMACGSASIGTTGWFSWYVTGLVQSLVDAGPETAYGLAAYSPSPGTNAWCRFDSREFANRPKLRVTGYYCVPIPPQPTVVAREEDGYLRLHWTNTGATVYRVLSSTTADGPYSLLLSTSDTTATVARTDTAGARGFYHVISASE